MFVDALVPRNALNSAKSSLPSTGKESSIFLFLQGCKGKNTDPTEESAFASSLTSIKSLKLESDRAGALVPQSSQSEFLNGLRKVQALQDHLEIVEEEEDGGGGDEGDRQILQAAFWEDGFRKVHFLQDQLDIAKEKLQNVRRFSTVRWRRKKRIERRDCEEEEDALVWNINDLLEFCRSELLLRRCFYMHEKPWVYL